MSILNKVTTGTQVRPFFIGLHGPPGAGKTTFFANAPKPLFLATEDGTDQLDVARLEIGNWFDFIKALGELNLDDHEYKTVVVDSADHLEKMIWEMVAKDHGRNSIEDIGFAKGYIYALDYWDKMLYEIKRLRKKGINVGIISHSIMRKMNDPIVGEQYDRFELKLHRKAADLITESMDALLFCRHEVLVSKDSQTKKVTAMGDGNRILYTEHRPAYDAKNRYGLPLELPLSWGEFSKNALRSDAVKTKELSDKIWKLMEQIKDEEFYKTVEGALDKFKNNVPKLEEILTKLIARISNE